MNKKQTFNLRSVILVKGRQELELEKNLQILGRGIGKVRISETGEIFVFDEKKIKRNIN